MQPYNTLQEVIKVALKVEALNKYRRSTTRSVAKEGFVEDSLLGILMMPKLPPNLK